MSHHARLLFVVLAEMGFHHVGQSGLKLLTSSDLHPLASQSAGITGMIHHTCPEAYYFYQYYHPSYSECYNICFKIHLKMVLYFQWIECKILLVNVNLIFYKLY